MRLNRQTLELFSLATAIGLVATFAAPWVELRGTFAAWRIVEWHTFWRGDSAFLLAQVVAANFYIPIEYATLEMATTSRALAWLGGALGVWHAGALGALLVIGATARRRAGASRARVTLEIAALSIGNLALLLALAWLLALPSSLAPKVDFRPGAEIHTDSLIWSGLTILPIAPALALIAVAAQIITLRIGRTKSDSTVL